jgi:hypothetical protein
MGDRTKDRSRRPGTLFCALLIVICLSGCESGKQSSAFYPIDSLLTQQVEHLTSIRAALFKTATLSGKTDTIHYTPGDTLAWNKELDVFRNLDIINKPVNKGNYRIDDGLLDPGSNLTVKAFESTKEAPVVYLRIYYQGSIRKPRKIEALYREKNVLYSSSRLLSLEFQQIKDNTVLTSYEIEGGQRMVMGDSVEFHIQGKVLID